MYNLLEGSGLDKVGPDKISFFDLSINLWSYGFHRFCISSIFSFWYSVPGWGCFEKMCLWGLICSLYRGKNCLYNPKIPMIIRRSPHVFYFFACKKPRFWTVQVVFRWLSLPSLKTCTCPETLRNFSVLVYCGGVYGHPRLFWNNLDSARLCSHTVTRSLDSVPYSICSFVIIATNVRAAFRSLIGITFHRHFTPREKNVSITHTSSSSTTC